MLEKLIQKLENLNLKLGTLVSYSTFLLVILISFEVILRYFLGKSIMAIREIETYLFAFIILWGAGYTLQENGHVRVDVFYERFSPKTQALINMVGGLFLLSPWVIILISVSWQMSLISLKIGEKSAQAGGLPAVYLLKFSIVVGFCLLFIQGLISVYRAHKQLKS